MLHQQKNRTNIYIYRISLSILLEKELKRILFLVEHVFPPFLFVMLIIRIHPKIISNSSANVNVQFEERFVSERQQAFYAACVFLTLTDLNDMEWKQVSLNRLYLFSSFLTLSEFVSVLYLSPFLSPIVSFLWPYYCLLWRWQ